MADEKKFSKKVGSFLFWSLLCLVASFIFGSIVVCFMGEEPFTAKLLFDNIFNGEATFTSLIIFAIVMLFVILTMPQNKSVKLKGKDKMENQRFLTVNELDKKFPHCFYHELKNFSHVGIPFRAVRQGNKIKIHFTSENHSIIVGATGTGKTVAFIEPTIQILSEMKDKPSLFITDVKGELYAHHSKKLAENGYNVLILDLTEPYNSLQWNPLENIYDNWQKQLHLEEEILKHTNDPVKNYDFIKVGEIDNSEWYEFDKKAFGTLREALLEVEVNKSKMRDECVENLQDIVNSICTIENEREKSWEQGARDYFLAVLIAMLEDSENESLGMTKEKYNFYNAYKIAMNKEEEFEIVKQYFSGRSPLSQTRQLSANITQTNAKTTRDGYMSTLNTKLSMFADMGISFLTSKNSIDFFNFDERPTAFFIKIPDERATRYSLATVCISQAYKQFVAKARANEKTTGKPALKRPLHYLMDEFANLPKVNELEKIITVSRSRKVFLHMVIQSYTQLDNVYGKENAGTVRGNCKATIYLGTPDQDTRKAFSEELGNYTIETTSKSSSSKKEKDGGGTTTNTQLQTVPLVYPADLDKIPLGQNITRIFQSYPIRSEITPYFKCTDIYKIGEQVRPFIPGRRLNEQEIYYDIKRRNRLVLTYDDE